MPNSSKTSSIAASSVTEATPPRAAVDRPGAADVDDPDAIPGGVGRGGDRRTETAGPPGDQHRSFRRTPGRPSPGTVIPAGASRHSANDARAPYARARSGPTVERPSCRRPCPRVAQGDRHVGLRGQGLPRPARRRCADERLRGRQAVGRAAEHGLRDARQARHSAAPCSRSPRPRAGCPTSPFPPSPCRPAAPPIGRQISRSRTCCPPWTHCRHAVVQHLVGRDAVAPVDRRDRERRGVRCGCRSGRRTPVAFVDAVESALARGVDVSTIVYGDVPRPRRPRLHRTPTAPRTSSSNGCSAGSRSCVADHDQAVIGGVTGDDVVGDLERRPGGRAARRRARPPRHRPAVDVPATGGRRARGLLGDRSRPRPNTRGVGATAFAPAPHLNPTDGCFHDGSATRHPSVSGGRGSGAGSGRSSGVSTRGPGRPGRRGRGAHRRGRTRSSISTIAPKRCSSGRSPSPLGRPPASSIPRQAWNPVPNVSPQRGTSSGISRCGSKRSASGPNTAGSRLAGIISTITLAPAGMRRPVADVMSTRARRWVSRLAGWRRSASWTKRCSSARSSASASSRPGRSRPVLEEAVGGVDRGVGRRVRTDPREVGDLAADHVVRQGQPIVVEQQRRQHVPWQIHRVARQFGSFDERCAALDGRAQEAFLELRRGRRCRRR